MSAILKIRSEIESRKWFAIKQQYSTTKLLFLQTKSIDFWWPLLRSVALYMHFLKELYKFIESVVAEFFVYHIVVDRDN